MFPLPHSPALGAETIPDDEAGGIEEILGVLRRIQEQKDRQKQPVPRTVHPKQHGCVSAELQVESVLPAELRYGVFREGRAYAALVRFSNAKQPDDRLPDGHGMAIKLLGVQGEKILDAACTAETQDFVLIDHPVFFARDVADFVPLVHDFERLMLGGVFAKIRTGLKAAFSRDHRFRLLRQAGAKRPDNPLRIRYWSTTPLKLGEGAMKVSLRPQLDMQPALQFKTADKLRRAMAEHLARGEARFDMLVQVQNDPVTMPIEDATVAWDEIASPFHKVATLRIHSQDFESPPRLAFGEALSFTPWHSLSEHRPLGGINRARRKIYEAMSAARRESNQATMQEPTLEAVRRVYELRLVE